MKSAKENIGISNEDRLSVDLSKIIEKKRRDLLRVTNSELVTLFWKIGKELNQYVGKNKVSEYYKSVTRTVSVQLAANYGPWFTEKNLKKMVQFAVQFPDFSVVTKIAPIINWEHILLLSQIKDFEARLFYIRLIAEQGLSVSGLRKQIYANAFKSNTARGGAVRTKGLGGNKTNNQKLLQILQIGLEQQSHNNGVIKNAFKEPSLSFLRPLMETSKKPAMLIEKNKKTPGIEEGLFGELSQLVEKYRHRQNRWINSFLNLSFGEIGKRINQEILLNSESIYRESIIRNASVQLAKKFDKNLSEKQLYEMANFAEQFTDLRIASRIAYLISWEHILALLSLQEIEAKLFYARLTATQGLSVAGLRKQIAKNVYEQTSGAKEREQSTMVALQSPGIKTRIKKKGNTTFIGTSIFIDIEDSVVVTNIFKSPYLPLLMLSAQKISDQNVVSHMINRKFK